MKRRTKILSVAVLLSCIAIGWPVLAHYRLKANLEAYRYQLQAKGEKLTVTELTPVISSEAVWSANTLLASANRLRGVVPEFTNQPPTMQPAAPGHAVVGWQQDPLPTAELTNVWPLLSTNLAVGQPALAQAHDALQSPQLGFVLDYSQGFNTLLPHLPPFKGIAQWLSAETIMALHEHRTEDARQSLQALVALTQRFNGEPWMISVLVRIGIGSIAANTTWEALQSPDLPEPQLQDLQAAWSAVDILPQAEAALAMERVMCRQTFAEGRQSFAAIAGSVSGRIINGSGLAELGQMSKEVLDDPKEGFHNLARRYPGYWRWKGWQSYEDELVNAQALQAGLEVLRCVRAQGAFTPALATFEQATNSIRQAHPQAGAWMDEYLVGAGGCRGFLSRVASFQMQRSVVITTIALKRYHLRHGAYPVQLSALVPEFLPQTPRDPMDGKPLRYRLNPDGSFLLYSVGEDGVDNGGDPSPASRTSNHKRWYGGRDVVWPTPASSQEMQAYYAELAAKRRPRSPAPANAALQKQSGLPPVPGPSTPVTNTASK